MTGNKTNQKFLAGKQQVINTGNIQNKSQIHRSTMTKQPQNSRKRLTQHNPSIPIWHQYQPALIETLVNRRLSLVTTNPQKNHNQTHHQSTNFSCNFFHFLCNFIIFSSLVACKTSRPP